MCPQQPVATDRKWSVWWCYVLWSEGDTFEFDGVAVVPEVKLWVFCHFIESSLKKVKLVSFKITVQDNRSKTFLLYKRMWAFLASFVVVCNTNNSFCCLLLFLGLLWFVCVCVPGSLLLLLLLVFVVDWVFPCFVLCVLLLLFCGGGLLLFGFGGVFPPLFVCLQFH